MFQIFRKLPPIDLCMEIIQAFGLESFNDEKEFTRKNIINNNTVNIINSLVPRLSEYYIPCKARSYLLLIDEKNVVTILRHIAKANGYKVVSKEKYHEGDKFINYQLLSIHAKEKKPLNGYRAENEEMVVRFD